MRPWRQARGRLLQSAGNGAERVAVESDHEGIGTNKEHICKRQRDRPVVPRGVTLWKRMLTILPPDEERSALWTACAERWTDNAHPLVHLSLEMLGHAERPILRLEAALQASLGGSKPERDRLLLECSALSIYWLFGLYEALRTLRQRSPTRFAPLADLFALIEVARMPLAKQEIKSVPGDRSGGNHYPTSCWGIDTGRVGWTFFDPRAQQMTTIFRTNIADDFLSIEAAGPSSA